MLVFTVSEADKSEPWAQELLNLCLEDGFEELMPAVVEFMQIGKKYVHAAEGHLSQNNLITAARDDVNMEKDLRHMFHPGEDGSVPFCVSSWYH